MVLSCDVPLPTCTYCPSLRRPLSQDNQLRVLLSRGLLSAAAELLQTALRFGR